MKFGIKKPTKSDKNYFVVYAIFVVIFVLGVKTQNPIVVNIGAWGFIVSLYFGCMNSIKN